MTESLIKRWAHAPWHSWIKHEPRWMDLFAELWTRLPSVATEQVLRGPRELIVLPPPEQARVVRLIQPLPAGASILQLDRALLDRPREEIIAILAHELAHLCTPIEADELVNDLAADRLVGSWGFRNGLAQALRRDLAGDHPRLQALPEAS